MAKKVPLDALSSEVSKILAKYGNSVQENLADITKDMAKQGTKTLKAQSRSMFGSGRYANGWTNRFITGRFSAQGIMYNGDVPGLPHLLENGHANRNGGRTPGRAHIKPVEEQLVREFENEVMSKL